LLKTSINALAFSLSFAIRAAAKPVSAKSSFLGSSSKPSVTWFRAACLLPSSAKEALAALRNNAAFSEVSIS